MRTLAIVLPSDPARRTAHSEAEARAKIKAKAKYFIVYKIKCEQTSCFGRCVMCAFLSKMHIQLDATTYTSHVMLISNSSQTPNCDTLKRKLILMWKS